MQKIDNNSKKKEYAIALFDVLGFSNMQAELGTEELYNKYSKLIEEVVLKKAESGFLYVKLMHLEDGKALLTGNLDVKYFYFSDTIILWTPFQQGAFSAFLATCSDLIIDGLKYELPLRGSISIGEAIMNTKNDIFIGSPIIEAANIERTQNWIGVTFGESMFEKPIDENTLSFSQIQINYQDHIKPEFHSKNSRLVLDWPNRLREKKMESEIVKIINNLADKTEKKYYYKNTIDFIDFSKKNEGWYEKIRKEAAANNVYKK